MRGVDESVSNFRNPQFRPSRPNMAVDASYAKVSENEMSRSQPVAAGDSGAESEIESGRQVNK